MDAAEITVNDYDQLYEMWAITENIGLSNADTRNAIAGYLERNPGFSTALQEDGKIIGAVLCGHDGRRGYLYHLVVRPEYRGCGLARKLVDISLGKLSRAGIEKCHIMVIAGNEDGRNF